MKRILIVEDDMALAQELQYLLISNQYDAQCVGEFNDVAGVKFGIGSVSPQYAARAAVDGMFKGKGIITPSLATGFTRFISKLVPDSLAARVVYVLQKKKEK